MKKTMFLLLVLFFITSCKEKTPSEVSNISTTNDSIPATTVASKSSSFNADSAYKFVADQVNFGYRIPNTPAHKACGDYLAAELKRFGADVYEQEMVVTAYNSEKLHARNIIGSYNKDKTNRVMLFAHWDSRPYGDWDPDESKHDKPIDGADDGASGVGVLLEIARQLNNQLPEIGVDIIFFDAEDYGTPEFVNDYKSDTWCLGSQFWAKTPHISNYKANYGILLDMVGSRDATFSKELNSIRYAPQIVEKVWSTAKTLGYGDYFVNAKGGWIVDDHLYVNQGRNIPSIDIINYNPNAEKGFGSHWHTQNDNMDNIDKSTLQAVGHTVLEVIYNEK